MTADAFDVGFFFKTQFISADKALQFLCPLTVQQEGVGFTVVNVHATLDYGCLFLDRAKDH